MEKFNTLPRRVVARIVDGSILFAVYWIITSIFSFSMGNEKLVVVFLYPLYYVVSLMNYGQTVGMFFIGTKLVLIEGEEKPDLLRTLLREMLGVYMVLVSILFLERYAQGVGDKFRLFVYTQTSWAILHFLVVAMSKQHRTIHDYLANTVVIKVMPLGAKPKKIVRYASVT